MASTNTRNKLSVYDTEDISAPVITGNNTFIPAFKPGSSNYKVPVSSFYDTFQTTSDMTAYYDKTEVYNKTEVDSKIADFGGYKVVELVNDKPDVATPDTKTIYLTKDDTITSGDSYKEWIWKSGDQEAEPPVPSAWDLIGDTSLNLSDYVRVTTSYISGNIARFGDDKTIEDTGYTVSDLEKINNKVTGWSVSPSNDYYPSEALVKSELDGKAPISHASATTGFGVGTTAMYGHVQVISGDLSGRNYSDGEAAAASHIHGQYLTNDDLPTEIINISYSDFELYTVSSIPDPDTFNDTMAILGKGHRPVIGIYDSLTTSGYDYRNFYPLDHICQGCNLCFSDYSCNNMFCLNGQQWWSSANLANSFTMISGTQYNSAYLADYLNRDASLRAKFSAVTDTDLSGNDKMSDIYLNTMEYNSDNEVLRWTGIYKHVMPYDASKYHFIDLRYNILTSSWIGIDKTLSDSIFS